MNATLLPSHLLRCDGSPHQPVLLILLFDTSTSVTGEADAAGARFDQAATAMERTRAALVAVRTFDRHSPSDVGPVPFDVEGRRRIAAALSVLPELTDGSSQLRPALLDAEHLARAHPRHRTVLAVFSDFQLLDSFPGSVLTRLDKFPGEVRSFPL